jgi:cation transport regulator ChaC
MIKINYKYVFQYGSNMSKERLNSLDRLNNKAEFLGVAKTKIKYNFGFPTFSKKGHAVASINEAENGNIIWGIIYRISDEYIYREKCPNEEKSLDQIEGIKRNGEGTNYNRKSIIVMYNGKEIEAITYIGNEKNHNKKTTFDYIEHILKGLYENGINDDYIEYVKKQILENNFSLKDKIEKYSNKLKKSKIKI